MKKHNIVLIGMPGAGKSTVGVLLAKALGLAFIDTDLLIQKNAGRTLQEILIAEGLDSFRSIEERTVLGLDTQGSVIATGGSVVYSRDAMEHLMQDSIVVYLKHSLRKIEQRIKNIKTRGIAMRPGQSLAGLYRERVPLYEKYAGITINCTGKHMEVLIKEIRKKALPHLESH